MVNVERVPVPAVTSRILDVDREHRMCGLELPECAFRPSSLLLSATLQVKRLNHSLTH